MSSAGIAAALPEAQSLMGQGALMGAKVGSGIDEALKDLKSRETEADTLEKSLDPSALKPPSLTPPPQPQKTGPIAEWGSAAMMVAALGGLFTRQHLTTALNGMGSVLNAFKQRDADATQQAYDAWKVQNENAWKAAQFTIDAYKAALAQIKEDRDGAKADALAVAAALKDESAPYIIEKYGLDAFVKSITDLQKHVDNLDPNGPNGMKIDQAKQAGVLYSQMHNAAQALVQAKQSKDPNKVADAQAQFDSVKQDIATFQSLYGKGGAGGATELSDDDLRSMADQYLAGDKSVVQGLGFGNQGASNRARLQDMIRKVAKERGLSGADIAASIAEFSGVTSGERTLGTVAARIGLGSAEAETLIPLVQKASEALPRTQYPTMNGWIQALQTQTGDPRVRDLAVKLQALKNAYSQVLTRGGVPTDTARAQADDLFATKDPDTVLNVAIGAVKQEAAAVKAAPGIVRKELREGIENTLHKGAPPGSIDALTSGTNVSVPPLPKGVPDNAQYSPSQNKWWWKDSTGKWEHN